MNQTAEIKQELRLQKWGAMYAEYKSSGKTVQEWCAEQELSVKTFYIFCHSSAVAISFGDGWTKLNSMEYY